MLRDGVAGLRLVAGVLEMLDAGGAPRLRVEPPYIVGADGARTDASLAVEGCAVDSNPAAPWGRRVTAPGAGQLHGARQVDRRAREVPGRSRSEMDDRGRHHAVRPSGSYGDADLDGATPPNGKVLVVGGRTSGTSTTGLLTADLFDPATSTWATTASIGTGFGRWSHTATQLTSTNTAVNGKVLVAGGINGTASVTSARLYDPVAGTWAAAASLTVARQWHTATVLSNNNVLLFGGATVSGSTTTVLATGAIFTIPASGAPTWTTVAAGTAVARRFHSATLLTSSNTNFGNRVLVIGGNIGRQHQHDQRAAVQLVDEHVVEHDGAVPRARGADGDEAGQRQRADRRRQERHGASVPGRVRVHDPDVAGRGRPGWRRGR